MSWTTDGSRRSAGIVSASCRLCMRLAFLDTARASPVARSPTDAASLKGFEFDVFASSSSAFASVFALRLLFFDLTNLGFPRDECGEWTRALSAYICAVARDLSVVAVSTGPNSSTVVAIIPTSVAYRSSDNTATALFIFTACVEPLSTVIQSRFAAVATLTGRHSRFTGISIARCCCSPPSPSASASWNSKRSHASTWEPPTSDRRASGSSPFVFDILMMASLKRCSGVHESRGVCVRRSLRCLGRRSVPSSRRPRSPPSPYPFHARQTSSRGDALELELDGAPEEDDCTPARAMRLHAWSRGSSLAPACDAVATRASTTPAMARASSLAPRRSMPAPSRAPHCALTTKNILKMSCSPLLTRLAGV